MAKRILLEGIKISAITLQSKVYKVLEAANNICRMRGLKRAFSVKEKYEICLERQKQVRVGKKMRLEEFGLLFPDESGKGILKSTLSDILALSDEILKNPPVEGVHEKKQKAPVNIINRHIRFKHHSRTPGLVPQLALSGSAN
ncbi:hypothetical protein EV426DRAFT_577962 [Tirmania nivea]|nr:hypothetical protein EV426DRAFT_577962 [Tirmania nivea]